MDGFEDIRKDGHLIARIDRKRWLLEIKNKFGCHLIDLTKYLGLASTPSQTMEATFTKRKAQSQPK